MFPYNEENRQVWIPRYICKSEDDYYKFIAYGLKKGFIRENEKFGYCYVNNIKVFLYYNTNINNVEKYYSDLIIDAIDNPDPHTPEEVFSFPYDEKGNLIFRQMYVNKNRQYLKWNEHPENFPFDGKKELGSYPNQIWFPVYEIDDKETYFDYLESVQQQIPIDNKGLILYPYVHGCMEQKPDESLYMYAPELNLQIMSKSEKILELIDIGTYCISGIVGFLIFFIIIYNAIIR